MYSWEIEDFLKIRNYILNKEEYIRLCDTSTQIKSITYKPFEDKFYIETTDDYKFEFKVENELTKSK